MSRDPNHVRDTAQNNFWTDSQTPKANEQMIPDAQTRETYNAEIERLRTDKK